ncbi:hypothetical protein YPPY34_2242, partial [Yersinia pestis PY-34]
MFSGCVEVAQSQRVM